MLGVMKVYHIVLAQSVEGNPGDDKDFGIETASCTKPMPVHLLLY